jgi:hypothetical protein
LENLVKDELFSLKTASQNELGMIKEIVEND